MRLVYVAGFFNPVKTAVDARFANDKSVIWIPQLNNGVADLKRLKELIFDALTKDAREILVIAFVLHGSRYQYVHDALDSICEEAANRPPALKISVEKLKDARGSDKVIKRIESFAPSVERKWPQDLDALEAWVEAELNGTVVLHPRAARAAKKSKFEDPLLIYKSLALLGEEYHRMKTLTDQSKAQGMRIKCDARLADLGLELTPSISESRAGEYGDDYYVEFPSLGDRKFLDQHLKKGSIRDERLCLRIYFYWDADGKRSIVGWLPSHLSG